jgi:hypothetical protein
MKFYWEQLSPREREALLRHFLLRKRLDAPVTAEGVCAALQKTHSLSCHSNKEGKLVFQFVTTARGAKSGASLAEDFSEGIYKAALRAKGVDVDDGHAIHFAGRRATAPASRMARAAG